MEGTAVRVQNAGSEAVIGKPQESLTVEEASDHPRNGQPPRFDEGEWIVDGNSSHAEPSSGLSPGHEGSRAVDTRQ